MPHTNIPQGRQLLFLPCAFAPGRHALGYKRCGAGGRGGERHGRSQREQSGIRRIETVESFVMTASRSGHGAPHEHPQGRQLLFLPCAFAPGRHALGYKRCGAGGRGGERHGRSQREQSGIRRIETVESFVMTASRSGHGAPHEHPQGRQLLFLPCAFAPGRHALGYKRCGAGGWGEEMHGRPQRDSSGLCWRAKAPVSMTFAATSGDLGMTTGGGMGSGAAIGLTRGEERAAGERGFAIRSGAIELRQRRTESD